MNRVRVRCGWTLTRVTAIHPDDDLDDVVLIEDVISTDELPRELRGRAPNSPAAALGGEVVVELSCHIGDACARTHGHGIGLIRSGLAREYADQARESPHRI